MGRAAAATLGRVLIRNIWRGGSGTCCFVCDVCVFSYVSNVYACVV